MGISMILIIMIIFFQPPFEENGIASPIDGQKFNAALDSTSLGTSIDSALVTSTSTFAKNRFLSGDHINANNREALLRRQLFAIGELAAASASFCENRYLILVFILAENDPTINAVEKAQKRASLLLEVTAATTSNSVVTTFSNGSLFPSLGSDRLDSVGMFSDAGANSRFWASAAVSNITLSISL